MTIEYELVAKLRAIQGALITVESCTGGLIAHQMTTVPGASEVLWGALVTYDNTAKVALAQVPYETIQRYGAVSRQVAQSLAEGGLSLLIQTLQNRRSLQEGVRGTGPNICIATTGIAGPGGGTPDKPVGLCYISIAISHRPTEVWEIRASEGSSREKNQHLFAQTALKHALNCLMNPNR